jgi:hypothetical protein
VNCPTSRCSAPATDPRTGWGAIALPRDPGLDRLLADPTLGSTAKTIATVLVKHWAWVKDHCWPSDRTIAAKIGKSQGHVQRCLRQLEDAGWIHRQRTDAVPTGRLIWLAWRCPTTSKGAQEGPAPAREGLAAPARDKRIGLMSGNWWSNRDLCYRSSGSPCHLVCYGVRHRTTDRVPPVARHEPEFLGMGPSHSHVTRHRVLVHIEQATGRSGPTTFLDVLQDGQDLVVGQAGLFQDGPLAFGEAGLAGAAEDHANPPALATPTPKGEIILAPETRIGAVGILATEVFDGVHVDPP